MALSYAPPHTHPHTPLLTHTLTHTLTLPLTLPSSHASCLPLPLQHWSSTQCHLQGLANAQGTTRVLPDHQEAHGPSEDQGEPVVSLYAHTAVRGEQWWAPLTCTRWWAPHMRYMLCCCESSCQYMYVCVCTYVCIYVSRVEQSMEVGPL